MKNFISLNLKQIIWSLIITSLCFLLVERTKLEIINDVSRAQIYVYDKGYTANNNYIVESSKTIDSEKLNFNNVFLIPYSDRFRFDFLEKTTIKTLPKVTKKIHYGVFTTRIFKLSNVEVKTNKVKKDINNLYNVDVKKDSFVDISLTNSNQELESIEYNANFIALFLLVLLTLCLVKNIRMNIDKSYYFIIYYVVLMFLIFNLPFNHGPDEFMHLLSGSWYVNHIMPPNLDSTLWFHPHYGSNYILFNKDLTYLITYKLSMVLIIFNIPMIEALRLSQLIIFGLIFLFIMNKSKKQGFVYLTMPMLFPQLGYMLTYYNGGILSYAFLYLAIINLSGLKKTSHLTMFTSIFIIINIKLNYTVIGLTLFAYWVYTRLSILTLRNYITILLFFIISSYKSIYIWYILKMSSITQMEFRENYASEEFFTKLNNGQFDFSIVFNTLWYSSSFKSLIGTFGYMNYWLPNVIYYMFMFIYLYFIKVIFESDKKSFILVLFSFFIMLAASLYYSISYDFQPQGRYLMPFVITLAIYGFSKIDLNKYKFIFMFTNIVAIFYLLTFLIIRVQ